MFRTTRVVITSLCVLLFAYGCYPEEVPTQVSSQIQATPTVEDLQGAKTSAEPIVPKSTNIPLPTATREKNWQQIGWLLQSNGGCDQPCFMGLIPEVTTLTEYKDFLSKTGMGGSETNPGYYSFAYHYKTHLGINAVVEIQGDVIKNIRVILGGFENSPTISRQDWSAFLPEKILQTYGKPSKVGFFISDLRKVNDPQPKVLFDFVFVYEDIDLVVYYDCGGIDDQKDGIYRFCPGSDKIYTINIWLGKYKETINEARYGIKLEDATFLSIEEFYERFTQNPTEFCLELNADAFLE